MIDWLFGLILKNPTAVRWVGRMLFSIGGVLVLCGLRADWLLSKVARRMARANVEGPQTLADMFPTLWTWWIPETLLGYQIAAFCLVAGFTMAQLAKHVLKYR